LAPQYTAHLFSPLLAELLAVLRRLAPGDWERPTVAGNWRVRDIAAHLLDGDLRKLALCRDGHRLPLEGPLETEHDLARVINGLNASGVGYAARLSPRLLTGLLEIAGGWVADYVAALPPHAPSLFAVSWAGEAASENWMDAGREYTELWHHQMQIRDAVGAPRLLAPSWMQPLLDFSVRALPHAYAALVAPAGTAVVLEVHGETAGVWSVIRNEQRWQVWRGRPDVADAVVRVRADDVWRLFYNALTAAELPARVQVTGAAALAEPLLRARSVIV
ncbi:MAG: maleylpyruvate isomerase N-terminal domain-containing protein, partial [Planctomycetes bacterium]|nr:maleylpyruvate isomerase N-terminal domain-containing protein [Planctomycetota bacterium]